MYYIHHSKRTIYTEQVVQDADLYNHVISGPSELGTQAGNTDKLAGTQSFDTYPPGSPARHGGAAVVADGSLVMEVVELLREPHGGAAVHRIPAAWAWHGRLMVLAGAALFPIGVMLARDYSSARHRTFELPKRMARATFIVPSRRARPAPAAAPPGR